MCGPMMMPTANGIGSCTDQLPIQIGATIISTTQAILATVLWEAVSVLLEIMSWICPLALTEWEEQEFSTTIISGLKGTPQSPMCQARKSR